ncbi:MAG: pyrophosphate--fructose-6-phosphate 1-phosphotransferase [Kiritimatiellae bacterium]|jgi:pyrophosphate--fructose-6-phosphate 1-phosphotransferase|nr:pyrophosphate--fructose-6-phosphate 1-phosphotransferase [Kiritimatiellia bacterium]
MKEVKKVAFLTAGGLAPCLSSSIGFLIDEYNKKAPNVEMIGYINGYMGLLKGNSIPVTDEVRKNALVLTKHGGSPIGNSRVKLTNVKDCVKRGLVKEGQDPLKVAADQLVKDGVDVIHTIGGDDTNTTAADLAKYLAENNYPLIVVGLPKTIDNDVYPIKQSLGAWTAAEEGAKFFLNVVKENSANPRALTIHEVMGRNCGWLTYKTAQYYRKMLRSMSSKGMFLDAFNQTMGRQDVHAVYIPECKINFKAEAARLSKIMEEFDAVNVFVSEGAGVVDIIRDMRRRGEEVPVDAFGHPRLDKVNVGQYVGKRLGELLNAEKVQVFKSGYFARSAAPNAKDLKLIEKCARKAVECALNGISGVVGPDENAQAKIQACEFERIKGGKPFNVRKGSFRKLVKDIGQPKLRKKRTNG